jgi:glycosyltransferase involved in cell wall biosynthesis
VEGWRFIAHSYAIVNQWQLLALSRQKETVVKVIDAPLHGRHWQTQEGLFDPQAERILRSFDLAESDESADVTLRIFFPLDFSPSPSIQTAVFGTSEGHVLRKEQFRDLQAYENFQKLPPPANVMVITPSRWSAEGFYKAGFKTEQVLIVPHGVDVGTFRPMPDLRGQIRSQIPVAEDDFVFFSAGAMTGNKGVDLLLQAFAEVCRKFPHARLVLKGLDSLYASKRFLHQNLQTVPVDVRQRVIDRIHYFGESLSFERMAMLYQAADVYVSPYRAEGFNLPVLEAAACGIPIICTRGGATDDFVTDGFARRIESKKVSKRLNDQDIWRLEPDLEHLIALMVSAIEDNAWRKRAAEAGPLHTGAYYTWDSAVDKLVGKLWN